MEATLRSMIYELRARPHLSHFVIIEFLLTFEKPAKGVNIKFSLYLKAIQAPLDCMDFPFTSPD
jgi:hypothetical protein